MSGCLVWKFRTALFLQVGRCSSVGITTDYRLDGPGIESRWGGFSAPVQTEPGVHLASCTIGIGSFPEVKSGRGVTLYTHPLLVPWSWKSRAIPLLPYRPYGLYRASVPVQRCTLPLPFLFFFKDKQYKNLPSLNDFTSYSSATPLSEPQISHVNHRHSPSLYDHF
jgi:hypothetical protein